MMMPVMMPVFVTPPWTQRAGRVAGHHVNVIIRRVLGPSLTTLSQRLSADLLGDFETMLIGQVATIVGEVRQAVFLWRF